MLAYAASRSAAGRQSSPNAMLFIIAAHVAALAILMSAKMDLPHRIFDRPLKVDTIQLPPDQPQQQPRTRQPDKRPTDQTLTSPVADVPMSHPVPLDGEAPSNSPEATGGGAGPVAQPLPQPQPPLIKLGPQLLTVEQDLKPPYPSWKESLGEEATLILRLSINDQGRVTAVDPVGRADRTFLETARRHLISRWRYRPASEGGRPIPSSTVITLSFRLDG